MSTFLPTVDCRLQGLRGVPIPTGYCPRRPSSSPHHTGKPLVPLLSRHHANKRDTRNRTGHHWLCKPKRNPPRLARQLRGWLLVRFHTSLSPARGGDQLPGSTFPA
eukprot:8815157-Pyramimonas_sp.AAC.1